MIEPSNDGSLYKELERIGYFKYCTEEGKIKLNTINLYESLKNNSIYEYYDDKSFVSTTKRNYHMDSEYLADSGGIESFIKNDLKPFYEASGFTLNIEEHIIKIDAANLNRFETIVVNDKKYQIFKKENVGSGEGWYIAPIRIAEMINSELERQNFSERFFLIGSGNDLSGTFLTPAQFQFFRKHIEDPYSKPETTKSWQDIYNVEIKS